MFIRSETNKVTSYQQACSNGIVVSDLDLVHFWYFDFSDNDNRLITLQLSDRSSDRIID